MEEHVKTDWWDGHKPALYSKQASFSKKKKKPYKVTDIWTSDVYEYFQFNQIFGQLFKKSIKFRIFD